MLILLRYHSSPCAVLACLTRLVVMQCLSADEEFRTGGECTKHVLSECSKHARLPSQNTALGTHGPTLLSKIGGGMRDFLVRPILLVEDVTYSLSPHGSAFVHVQKERETEKELERARME